MRFQVRKSISDLGYVFFRIWDTSDRRFVFATTRQSDAESFARRFEQASQAEAVQRMEAGSW